MNKNTQKNILVVAVIIGVVFILFWQFFLKGLYPYPGDYTLAWYEPFKSEYFIDNRITLPHKAVAEDVFRQIYPFITLAVDMHP